MSDGSERIDDKIARLKRIFPVSDVQKERDAWQRVTAPQVIDDMSVTYYAHSMLRKCGFRLSEIEAMSLREQGYYIALQLIQNDIDFLTKLTEAINSGKK